MTQGRPDPAGANRSAGAGAGAAAGGSRRPGRLLLLALSAAVGGLLLGWLTAGFFWVVNELISLLWDDLPAALGIDTRWYAVVVCTAGGILVGLGRRFLGDHPAPLDELLSHDEGTRGFDIRVLPQALYLLAVSLVFGGALGPELGLVFLGGSIAVALTRLLNREAAGVAQDIAIAAVFTALFASPLGGTATAVEKPGSPAIPRAQRVLLALISGLAALKAFAMVPTPGFAIAAAWPAYEPAGDGTEALWAVPLGLIGLAIGLLYHRVHGWLGRLSERVAQPLLLGTVGGLVLGALGSWNQLLLFSGEDGIDDLVGGLGTRSAADLAVLAAVKLVLVALLLGAGWKGGHFYPMLFVATAAALSLSQLMPALNPVVSVAGVAAGVLVATLRRVAASAFLVLLVVPAALLGVAAVAALVGFLVLRLAGPTGGAAPVDRPAVDEPPPTAR